MFRRKAVPQRAPASDTVPSLTAALIKHAYKAILLREPDPEGLSHWSARIADDPEAVEEFLGSLLRSDEFASRVKPFLNFHIHPQKLSFLHDNSQNGELALLLPRLVRNAVTEPFLVDVGAYGRSGSNSYDLLRHYRWRGLLIEPNIHLLDRIRAEFVGVEFTLVNAAATGYEGMTNLYLGVHDEISSIHRENTAHWGDVHGHLEVRAAKLPTLLEENAVPKRFGLLSIDCEGEGFNLLDDTLEAGYEPDWIIIEVYKGLEIESLDELPMSAKTKARYRIAERTFANLILERIR